VQQMPGRDVYLDGLLGIVLGMGAGQIRCVCQVGARRLQRRASRRLGGAKGSR
jgi:hypothetical protein